MAHRADEAFTCKARSFIEYCRTEGRLIPSTWAGYETSLRFFASFLKDEGVDPDRCTPAEIEPDMVRRYMAYLLKRRGSSPPTAGHHLSVLRSFYRHLVKEEGFPADQVPTAEVQSPSRFTTPVTVTSEEVARLLEGASRTPTPQRDVAFVQLLFHTGCRPGEALDLGVADLKLAQQTVRLTGLRGRQRRLPLAPAAAGAIRRYLEGERRALLEWLGVSGSRWLFLGVRGLKMGGWELKDRLQLISKLAGLRRAVTPQMLRDTRVVLLLQAGVDPRSVRALIGYSSPISMHRYRGFLPRRRGTDEKLSAPGSQGPRTPAE